MDSFIPLKSHTESDGWKQSVKPNARFIRTFTGNSIRATLVPHLPFNNMPERVSEGTEMRHFADDSLLYREIKNVIDTIILQNDIYTLQEWEDEWKMKFHPKKWSHQHHK